MQQTVPTVLSLNSTARYAHLQSLVQSLYIRSKRSRILTSATSVHSHVRTFFGDMRDFGFGCVLISTTARYCVTCTGWNVWNDDDDDDDADDNDDDGTSFIECSANRFRVFLWSSKETSLQYARLNETQPTWIPHNCHPDNCPLGQVPPGQPSTKAAFIATQLNSTQLDVELSWVVSWVALYTSTTQLNSTRRRVELSWVVSL